MRATRLGAERHPHGLAARLRALFGHSVHLWMWDEPSLAAALRQAGFTEIRRCSFNDSADPAFRPVEARERFGDTVLGLEECAMEARKPFGRRLDQN